MIFFPLSQRALVGRIWGPYEPSPENIEGPGGCKTPQIGTRTTIFSRVQRDSICHFVGLSVCWSVGLSVGPAFAFLAVLSILSHFKSIKKI